MIWFVGYVLVCVGGGVIGLVFVLFCFGLVLVVLGRCVLVVVLGVWVCVLVCFVVGWISWWLLVLWY